MNPVNLEKLRSITPRELALLGVAEIAYIKPIIGGKTRQRFALYAADGTMIGFSATPEVAKRAARRNNLVPQSLH